VAAYRTKRNCPYVPGTRYAQDIAHLRQKVSQFKICHFSGEKFQGFWSAITPPLTPNDPYSGRTAPLTLKRCILYIYSTNICTEYFKHGIYSPFFFLSSKWSLFHNSNVFGSCIINILYTGCAKIKKIIPAPKVKWCECDEDTTALQRRVFANCDVTLYLFKAHLQTFVSVPITQKCQILSGDTLVANERNVNSARHISTCIYCSM